MACLALLGHFGSHFSYATIAVQLARALREAKLLGGLINLDDQWHPDYTDLEAHRSAEKSQHVLVLTVPTPLLSSLPYKRRALYLSPNTNQLAPEHRDLVRQTVHQLVVPSAHCAHAVESCGLPTTTLRLGVDPCFLATRLLTEKRLLARLDQPPRFLHLTTDFWLPGRKGTTELIAAWLPHQATLLVHAPAQVVNDLTYAFGDAGLFPPAVQFLEGPQRGLTEPELSQLLAEVDGVILPSRCEGFGMTILSALVQGVPTLTTNVTGQRDFLPDFPTALKIATREDEPLVEDVLAGEFGTAPVLAVEDLTTGLFQLASPEVRRRVLTDPRREHERVVAEHWLWPAVLRDWVDALRAWVES